MNRTMFDRRRAGLLVPVYALRHAADFGIGDTAALKDAIDFAADQGFSVVQILPIHETIGDHSPYNPISSRALSPALLALNPIDVPGLTQAMLDKAAPEAWLARLRMGNVHQEVVHPLKLQVLLTAYHHFTASGAGVAHEDFHAFLQSQAGWLDPYTLFRLLVRDYEGNARWSDWRPEHQSYQAASAWLVQHPGRAELESRRSGFAYIQWVAWRQWKSVRDHADDRGVRLMGEMSFGVGMNSADVWSNPALFDTDWSLGTPPLAHFDTTKDSERWGQNWGLPPYRWENHRSSSFAWLRGRVEWEKEFFHGCRIDHLRGYFRAYMFPWQGGPKHVEFSQLTEEETALRTGGLLPRFVPGPDDDPVAARMNELQGREIIGQIIDAAGEMDLVAEIMGEMPAYMRDVLTELQLAHLCFPQLEKEPGGSIRRPADFPGLCLVTYANHDNAPLASLYLNLRQQAGEQAEAESSGSLAALCEFIGVGGELPTEIDDTLLAAFQSALMATRGKLAVLMCSDLIGVPLRFNLPGSYGEGTWSDRLEMPLADLARHPVYGPRIATASGLVVESGRA